MSYATYDLINRMTGAVVVPNETAVKLADFLGVNARTLRAKVAGTGKRQTVYGDYIVKQCGEISNVLTTHRKLPELVDEFLRVCREPKLWKTIDDTYLGDWYINDSNKAVLVHEEV